MYASTPHPFVTPSRPASSKPASKYPTMEELSRLFVDTDGVYDPRAAVYPLHADAGRVRDQVDAWLARKVASEHNAEVPAPPGAPMPEFTPKQWEWINFLTASAETAARAVGFEEGTRLGYRGGRVVGRTEGRVEVSEVVAGAFAGYVDEEAHAAAHLRADKELLAEVIKTLGAASERGAAA
ncbi:Hypothetical protein AAM4_2346 [Actinomyces succiniciruminis]|uniref:Uncharacterized protein n=2 Tax=Actinomyces succiniciruminis TaxID=1522002 RepID=A0A1L7RRJ1_9ACTO|nr:Hypothetical protein AAM4_2346 [Actinomyces succiniciruminis]